jgi:hypothetical protein
VHAARYRPIANTPMLARLSTHAEGYTPLEWAAWSTSTWSEPRRRMTALSDADWTGRYSWRRRRRWSRVSSSADFCALAVAPLAVSHHAWQAVDAKQWVAGWRLSGAASSRRGRDHLLALAPCPTHTTHRPPASHARDRAAHANRPPPPAWRLEARRLLHASRCVQDASLPALQSTLPCQIEPFPARPVPNARVCASHFYPLHTRAPQKDTTCAAALSHASLPCFLSHLQILFCLCTHCIIAGPHAAPA